jgi:hypothetical protein
MKKLLIVLFVLALSTLKSSDVNGQQVLWTTIKEMNEYKYLPIGDVKSKVVEFYDTYYYRQDQTGYDIDTFFKFLNKTIGKGVTNDRWREKLKENQTEKMVICMKTNSGSGSVISVIFLGEKSFDTINFSNTLFVEGGDINRQDEEFKRRFLKWYDSLM